MRTLLLTTLVLSTLFAALAVAPTAQADPLGGGGGGSGCSGGRTVCLGPCEVGVGPIWQRVYCV